MRDHDLQTHFPSDAALPTSGGEWSVPRIGRVPPEVARAILYVALILLLVAIFPHLRANLWSESRARRLAQGDGREAVRAAVASRMEEASVRADDLAARGEYAGAMHVMLLRGIGELRRGMSVSIAASWTSREILREVALNPQGRAALADIIERVEISYFGTHRPSEEEYRACRRSFDLLTDALRSEGAEPGGNPG